MKRTLLAALLISGLFAGSAAAQYRGPVGGLPVTPSTSPALSPYLNLLRPGDPAVNYYLGTVPEVQRRANTALFGSTLNQILPQVEEAQGGPSAEDIVIRLTVPTVPAGYNRLPPPRYFGRTAPGTLMPLPMPPEPRVPPRQRPMDRL